MSLSRPARFPLLKLPWLCVKCVIQNSDLFNIIFFATISNRTRRVGRNSNYPLKEIDVVLSGCSKTRFKDGLGKVKSWFFIHNKNADNGEFVLQLGSQPFRISRCFDTCGDANLHSYTAGDELDALKMGIEFMIDVFGCSIRQVFVDGNKISQLFGLGISTVKELNIGNHSPVNITDLKYMLENVNVTDSYVFYPPIPTNFSCNPQIFKCRKLYFGRKKAADWVTLEILCQLDVSQLFFLYHRFSVEDIVSYVTYWFNSKNRKLEFLHIKFNNPISLEDFKIEHLNPMPFCKKRRNRCLFVGRWKGSDMSSGMDILRQDGLLATFYVETTSIIFHVWHKRFPDSVQQ